ncbi:TRAP transporter substrate-binding protein [Halomonas sp. AOP42-C1-46]|uniref:TRAP transporter substrate-binding protein n=1 Tax=Halomonas sp. AOP42-C1-46 TaxID=3457671 RepID=UPI004034887B
MRTAVIIKKTLTKLSVLACTSLFAGAAFSQTVDLRIATGTPPSHVWSNAANELATLLNEKSNGEFKLSVFPASQLGNENEILQQLQAGIVDLGIVSAAASSARAPEMLAWFTPFAMDNIEDTVHAADTEVAQEILDSLQPQGIRGLGYTFAGMRHILMKDEEISSLDDLNNKKIRITPFSGMQTWWRAAGATPTPIQLGEVYQALNSGLIDGVDIDLDALEGLSLDQVATELTLTSHMAFPGVLMISESSWNRLTDEQKSMLREAADITLENAANNQIAAERRITEEMRGRINVKSLENAESIFTQANDGFEREFSDIPTVKRFMDEF